MKKDFYEPLVAKRDVRGIFETVSALDALVLRRRLDANRADDALAVAFSRLLAERCSRLKAYLADPRRRKAYR